MYQIQDCCGVKNPQHFLILCRFAAPPQVARRHPVSYLRGISIWKTQRSMSFTSLGGSLTTSNLRNLVVDQPIFRRKKNGNQARELSSSLMKHRQSKFSRYHMGLTSYRPHKQRVR